MKSAVNNPQSIAVQAGDKNSTQRANQLAKELQLPLYHPDNSNQYSMLLEISSQGLQLCLNQNQGFKPLKVDFGSGAIAHRHQFGGGKGQMIAKAVGIKNKIRPVILDATAGLGKDSFVLATLGCHIQLIERSPLIHALLADGIKRAATEPELQPIIQRMLLLNCNDSIEWMQQQALLNNFWQVVYLDPMFPERTKSSLVKKEMQIFKLLLNNDLDSDSLLEAAFKIASHRIVVKRPRKAPFLAAMKPSLQFIGKSSRYDVYSFKKLQPKEE